MWQVGGCATLAPASEGLVFSDDESELDNNSSFVDNLSGEFVGGISYIVPFNSFERAAVAMYGNDSLNTLDKAFLFALPLPSFSVSYRHRIALGSTVPLPGFWQIDATIRLFNQYYLVNP